ncbi:beta-N-acetylhexosaminidase [Paenibacillus sp. P32E]|uniref:beta-N-acetylhexosaminidase n=1 Tax=Paenibacillus sp. P32E TaxID=1349434 RepID=UPI0009393F55|nr:beta-N-acetylhexosaminidase [Paenibacillus sp. P32E]
MAIVWREVARLETGLDAAVAAMSLNDKIGQVLMCGFDGTAASDEVLKLVADNGIGGVIYFARNVESPEQVALLTADLQKAAAEGGKAPLWISMDQEGGMVARITGGIALMPGGMAIAAAGSLEDAYQAALISGRELAAMGINLNYAPVLDVNNNPQNPVIGVRSFGESPELAADYGAAMIRGYQEAGVAATAKHFPGHGDTDVDSHLDLPMIPHGRERMDQVELVPFRRAIAEGVDAMMSAHIYFPALEREKLPVTLSKTVLTGLLREELGYQGIIMTDCMEMNAIAEHYGTVEASVLAVEAGADMVLVSHRADRQLAAMEAIRSAVTVGRISEARIDESVRRLLALKVKRGVIAAGAETVGEDGAMGAAGDDPGAGVVVGLEAGAVGGAMAAAGNSDFSGELADLGTAAHLEVARRISEASITLVRNNSSILPLKKTGRTLVITAAPVVATLVDESFSAAPGLGAMLARHGLDSIDRVVPAAEIGTYAAKLLEEARAEEVVQIVVGTYNAQFHAGQIELVELLLSLGKPLVIVALRNPYDLLAMPGVQAYAATYESRPLALESVAQALLGHIAFQGKLPVSLGGEYPAGWGMRL